MNLFYKKYLLPGLVFQGVVIGGGYATGRELVEFFLPHGPLGGLLAMAVAACIWSIVMAVSFELCRMTSSYDYKTFFQQLLGRYWFTFEVLLVILMVIVLAVIAAAAGEIIMSLFGLPSSVGVASLLLAIGVLTFYGSNTIERFMGAWSILLYIVYFSLTIITFIVLGDDIKSSFSTTSVHDGSWALDGLRYAGYNLATIPAVLFCLNHITKRKEAVCAGLLAGLIGMLPAIFLYVAMMAHYPSIGLATVPSTELLSHLNLPWFSVLFKVVLLGTFIQTGVALVHAVNERIAVSLAKAGKSMGRISRPIIAMALLIVALFLASTFGLVALIAKGYGFLTFGFIAVFVVPVLTVGVYKVVISSND